MNVVVAVVIVGAIVSICVGLVTAVVDMFAVAERRRDPEEHPQMMIGTGTIYWSYTLWTIALGGCLMIAPDWWFGPSWSYFDQIPHNGFGMGLCLTLLSAVQAVALWRRARPRVLALLFFLNGFVYWVAGIILGMEGLLGHRGLIAALFMLWVGAQAFAHSAALNTYAKYGDPP